LKRAYIDAAPDMGPTAIRRRFEESAVADVVCVVLIVAVFAVLALVVKGVERLER
jgi:hypothetical protein